jgi:serine/threonine-protein kinase RsbW
MGVAGSSHPKRPKKPTVGRSSPPTRGRAPSNGVSRRAESPLEFVIPSDLAASRDVHKQIMDRVESSKYDEQSVFAIRLALEEGLMNAIRHGNKLDARKVVYVVAKVTPKATEIVIEDQGKGFDRSSVPDPCAHENLLKCSGRGILLMEAYMDKVDYSKGGRRVKMVKKNG